MDESSGVLILDEIDSNLSGEESESVGKLLHILSKNYQILSISHQPQ
jgi:DNA repair protein RecN (Recombination protein N)